MKKKIILLSVIMTTLFSCHNKTGRIEGESDSTLTDLVETDITYAADGDTIRHARLRYFDFDTIEDLKGYFHTLSTRYPIVKWMGEEDEIDDIITNCIAQIDGYRKGTVKYYPDSLVRRCINYMGFNISAINNHSSGVADLLLAEWVMMCAAYYSPDITCLVETQTPDHRAGFNNIGKDYNDAPWWAYLFVKREKGYQVISLGDYVKVRSIFQLSDSQGRTYYLCSNNFMDEGFGQWLYYAKDSETYIKVAECKDAQQNEDAGNKRYYFDKNNLIWKYARIERQTGKLIATQQEPAIKLILDGENSRFIRGKNNSGI